ncbi:DNA primase [Streptomyces sp. Ru73]|uniref:DNA primase n=1 Tax=Streptomyces sp. Ru73 TaxID=2080748 RepID=UPI000CDE20E6|nr:DNA primase [Streptomyces sp. Ru73]POX39333.1 DNA primase [Streptomyces sp. Ru73]
MNNRAALALAVAGGYALGRTKKMKLALGVGGMVLGRRLQTDPQRLLRLVDERLKKDPQLAELRDQLREDLGGVGRAAASAFLDRRIDGLASSLHERTLSVQDRIAGGTAPSRDGSDDEGGPDDDAREADGEAEVTDGEPEGGTGRGDEEPDEDRTPRARTPRKKAAGRTAPARRPAKAAAKSGTKAASRTTTKKATSRAGTKTGGKAGTRSAGGAGSSSGRSRGRTDG